MSKTIRLSMLACLILLPTAAYSQTLRPRVEDYVRANGKRILAELTEFLSIPNPTTDPENLRLNARHLRTMLQSRGFVTELLETAGNPLVFAEKMTPGASRTILFYFHYDGQPVDPEAWKQADPFEPVLRDGPLAEGGAVVSGWTGLETFNDDWRLYARSASDDKAPIVGLCAALDALDALGTNATSNMRIILDGEEEIGSPNLASAVEKYHTKFEADIMMILDGPSHPSGRPTLNFGARGIVSLDVTVFGAKVDLHSGHYGNWAPNPAIQLTRLLASMKDEHGRVLVKGFYDDVPPLSDEVRQVLDAVPDDLEALKKLFGISHPDRVGSSLQEAIQFPSLNLRGLLSAYVGAEARTIIPAKARASIDLRLVKETSGESMIAKIRSHTESQGFHLVDHEPDDATRRRYRKIARIHVEEFMEAYRTELDHPISMATTQALERVWGETPVRIRTSGGSVPTAPFIRMLGFPAISVPTVNFDNNQHSADENLRLGHFWKSIVTFAALLTL